MYVTYIQLNPLLVVCTRKAGSEAIDKQMPLPTYGLNQKPGTEKPRESHTKEVAIMCMRMSDQEDWIVRILIVI